MKDNILVDTSIWIEFFNKNHSVPGDTLEQMLLEGRVLTAGIVLTELLQGAKVEHEFEAIKETLSSSKGSGCEIRFLLVCNSLKLARLGQGPLKEAADADLPASGGALAGRSARELQSRQKQVRGCGGDFRLLIVADIP